MTPDNKSVEDENAELIDDSNGSTISDNDELLDEDFQQSGDLIFRLLHEKSANRIVNPDLPTTVSTLDCSLLQFEENPTLNSSGDCFGKVYIVGTAHFSEDSQNDVANVISAVQPDVVMVELCSNRVSILSMDEEKLLEEAKNLNMEKIMSSIKQSGLVQGIMHCMLLSMSAHVTKQLGMAPGGEFRAAFREFQKVPGCKLHLGDRPVQITLQRAFGSLGIWQKIRLFVGLVWSHGMKITKEDVEKAKRRDLLEELLREMAGEFPDLSRIFVEERDRYMAHVLRELAYGIYCHRRQLFLAQHRPLSDLEKYPVVIVGVVGMGHVPGIVANWAKTCDLSELLVVPERKKWPRLAVWSLKGILLGLSSYMLYRGCLGLLRLFKVW